MKKIFLALVVIIGVFFIPNVVCLAANVPEYDVNFNNGNGGFFANGNDIEISKDEANNTVIIWNGGNQIVKDTVSVFGGGREGSLIEEARIIMNDGTVDSIVAGGVSTDENNSSYVKNSEIVLNNGVVSNKISGGGYLYSTVDNSKVTINGGSVCCINGGGFASTLRYAGWI